MMVSGGKMAITDDARSSNRPPCGELCFQSDFFLFVSCFPRVLVDGCPGEEKPIKTISLFKAVLSVMNEIFQRI